MKDRVNQGDVILKYKNTREMIADVLTKHLQGATFERLGTI